MHAILQVAGLVPTFSFMLRRKKSAKTPTKPVKNDLAEVRVSSPRNSVQKLEIRRVALFTFSLYYLIFVRNLYKPLTNDLKDVYMPTKAKPARLRKDVLSTHLEHAFPPNAGVHIDKIHMTGPLTHKARGTLNYAYDEVKGVVPSHTFPKKLKAGRTKDVVTIHSRDIDSSGNAHKLEIQCCPPILLQRHNIFGHSSVLDYVNAIFDVVVKMLGIEVAERDLKEWRKGAVWITVIHLTCNFRCSEHDALPIIDAIDQDNRCGKHRDYLTCVSLGFTPEGRSQHHGLTVYYKPAQLEKVWKKAGTYQNKLLEYIVNSIRAEVKLFGKGLEARGLQYAMDWEGVDIAALYFEIFDKYNVKYAIQRQLTDHDMKVLTTAEANAYLLWLNGRAMSDQFESRSTAHKYIKSILTKTGVNTAGNRRPEPLPEIHLLDIFRAENALPVPDWLFDTQFYVAPK